MRETWYVLEDGNVADPREVAPDESGALRHKSGVAVAMRGEVPHGRGVDVDPDRKPAPTEAPPKTREVVAEKPKPAAHREMKAGAGAKKYKTR